MQSAVTFSHEISKATSNLTRLLWTYLTYFGHISRLLYTHNILRHYGGHITNHH